MVFYNQSFQLQSEQKLHGGFKPNYNYSPYENNASNNIYSKPQTKVLAYPNYSMYSKPNPASMAVHTVKKYKVYKVEAIYNRTMLRMRYFVIATATLATVGAITAAVVVSGLMNDSKGLCRDPKYTFKCNETFCLLPYQVCDGKIDCEDGTDEANCTCKFDQYLCKNGKCLDNVFLCDGVKDCPEGDDEFRPSCVSCTGSKYKCFRSNECIDRVKRCDGANDCKDSSDETGCFQLISGKQIVKSQKNGIENLYTCASNVDDYVADKICVSNGYREAEKVLNISMPDVTTSNFLQVVNISNDNIYTRLVNSCHGFLGINCTAFECGTRAKGRNYGQYIINGFKAVKGAWPWHVDMKIQGSSCGAVLISEEFVLTAAHCVKFDNKIVDPSGIKLSMGMVRLDDPSKQDFFVQNLSVHQNFSTRQDLNDLALLKLTKKVVFSNDINSICLSAIQEPRNHYKYCVSTGLGKAGKDLFLDNLLQTRLNIYSQKECASMQKMSGYFSNLCVGSIPGIDRNNICFGDSGGPFSCMNDDGRWFLVGIHSYVYNVNGEEYGKNDYRLCQTGVVVNVANYLDWIEKEMKRLMWKK